MCNPSESYSLPPAARAIWGAGRLCFFPQGAVGKTGLDKGLLLHLATKGERLPVSWSSFVPFSRYSTQLFLGESISIEPNVRKDSPTSTCRHTTIAWNVTGALFPLRARPRPGGAGPTLTLCRQGATRRLFAGHHLLLPMSLDERIDLVGDPVICQKNGEDRSYQPEDPALASQGGSNRKDLHGKVD